MRILLAFDSRRRAILLLAGDKQGAWSKWYRMNVPVADDRYDEHLQTPREEKGGKSDGEDARRPAARAPR